MARKNKTKIKSNSTEGIKVKSKSSPPDFPDQDDLPERATVTSLVHIFRYSLCI